jgi:hypothetical protein
MPLPSPAVQTYVNPLVVFRRFHTESIRSVPVDARPVFSLNLSSSISIPIKLKDITQSASGSLSLDAVVTKCPNGPPGKFYRDQFALSLLDCLRTGGSAARISVDEAADESQKSNFERFCARLLLGELVRAIEHLFSGNR